MELRIGAAYQIKKEDLINRINNVHLVDSGASTFNAQWREGGRILQGGSDPQELFERVKELFATSFEYAGYVTRWENIKIDCQHFSANQMAYVSGKSTLRKHALTGELYVPGRFDSEFSRREIWLCGGAHYVRCMSGTNGEYWKAAEPKDFEMYNGTGEFYDFCGPAGERTEPHAGIITVIKL